MHPSVPEKLQTPKAVWWPAQFRVPVLQPSWCMGGTPSKSSLTTASARLGSTPPCHKDSAAPLGSSSADLRFGGGSPAGLLSPRGRTTSPGCHGESNHWCPSLCANFVPHPLIIFAKNHNYILQNEPNRVRVRSISFRWITTLVLWTLAPLLDCGSRRHTQIIDQMLPVESFARPSLTLAAHRSQPVEMWVNHLQTGLNAWGRIYEASCGSWEKACWEV